jgi:hypothetical protein
MGNQHHLLGLQCWAPWENVASHLLAFFLELNSIFVVVNVDLESLNLYFQFFWGKKKKEKCCVQF